MSFFQLRTCTLTQQHVAHEHNHHQLILATSGVTELCIEHRGERITRARGCLIPSTHHHEYQGDGNNRTLVLDVPLAGLTVMRGGEQVERLFDAPRFFAVTPQLQRLTATLLDQVDATPQLHDEIANLLLRALHLSLHDSVESRGGKRPRRGGERLDLARLDAYIDAHLGDEIRVEDLAALCAMSPGYFHACFRQTIGQTPLAYVQCRRLMQARRLVHDTELALGHIAQVVGFRDQGSFSRAYRRQFDVAPSSQRRLSAVPEDV